MSVQRAEEILNFIKNYIEKEHISPSVREIREGVGIQSTSTIHRYLHRLEEEQKIHMLPGKNRSIVITEKPAQAIPLIKPVHSQETTEEHIIAYISYTPSQSCEAPLFAVQAEQDIPEAEIHQHDILIAERSEQFAENKYLLFLDAEQHICVTKKMIPETAFGTLISLIRNF